MNDEQEFVNDEYIAEFDVRSPAERTLITVIGTLLVAALAVGTVVLVSHFVTKTRTVAVSLDVSDIPQISLRSGGADVHLVQADGDAMTFSAVVTSGLRDTHYELLRNGGEIVIDSECRAWVVPGCGAEVTVGLPAGMSLLVESTSGDIEVTGGSGGVLTLLTSSGSIEADEFSASTGSGDVEVEFASAPYALKVDTGSGDIEADVIRGERTYTVDLRSDSGEVESDVKTDPQGEGFIRLTSRSGDIELDWR